MSVLLKQLHKAELALKRTAALLLLGSATTAATTWFLLGIEPRETVAALLAGLLAVFALRTAQRSRLAVIVSALLHGLIAGLLLDKALTMPLSVLGAAAAAHGLLCLIALNGLRRIGKLIRAELAAARPVTMDEVQMPGPPAARVAPIAMPILPTLASAPTMPVRTEPAMSSSVFVPPEVIPEVIPCVILEQEPGRHSSSEPVVLTQPATTVDLPVRPAILIELEPETPAIVEPVAAFSPAPQPLPPSWLPTIKRVDHLGRVQCPRCSFRQVDSSFCAYCNLDLDRNWLAAPQTLSSSLPPLSSSSG